MRNLGKIHAVLGRSPGALARVQPDLPRAVLAHTPEGRAFQALGCFRKVSDRGPLPYPTCVLADRSHVVRHVETHDSVLRRTRPRTFVEQANRL